jgi:hypothetical protein
MKGETMQTFSPAIRVPLALLCAGGLTLSVVGTAAASAPGNQNGAPDLALSTYGNANNRPDPFLPVRLKAKGAETKGIVDESELQLQGILWDPTKPVAIINRQRVSLNEVVTLKLSSGEHLVKATAMHRDRVVLKVDDREVELRMAR